MGDTELARQRADALTVSMSPPRLGHLLGAQPRRYRTTSHLVDSTATPGRFVADSLARQPKAAGGGTTSSPIRRHTM